MINGVWKNLPWLSLVEVLAFCGLLLAAALWLTAFLSRRLRFSREDRIAIIFCGSKKSLATGIPMMNVIFAGAPIGLLVIPIMVFHQLQLMVCSFLARKWAKDVGKREQL